MNLVRLTPMHHLRDRGKLRRLRHAAVEVRLAIVAILSKGYDLDYIWRQVDRGLTKDAAGYYM
jgi:hypothetical protein